MVRFVIRVTINAKTYHVVIQISDDLKITSARLDKILSDPQATAKAVKLVYVNDSMEGYTRIKSQNGFRYLYKNKALKDKTELQRIRSLVLPPAWEKVWICAKENGHLQATGSDTRNRKQYRYHPLWNQLRNQTKFYRMLQFGKVLPSIRKQVQKDLASSHSPKEKILATVIALMERTCIRVGSESYEKMYGSFGLTTLKDKHVEIKGSNMNFSFKGKKGVEHDISIKSPRLAKIVKQCRDIPGKELFQYYDEQGNKQTIDSGMVNEYLRSIVDGEFTSKDFRTWAGTVQALIAFKEVGEFENKTHAKKNIVEVLDKVSKHLGNTRTVCKKYYVHPSILDMYESASLATYFDKLKKQEDLDDKPCLTCEEKVLMEILEKL
ncbi:MAG: DNA topoisomerase IB [Chitinophagaceae bacterium]|nr:DNA topoisomerase IB [Chitinophagaceae bacterium]